MSSVRMCDRCQEIFSELDLGWQVFTATTVDEDDNGNQVTRTVNMDACAKCAVVPVSRQRRRTARLERAAGIEPTGEEDPFTLKDDADLDAETIKPGHDHVA